MRAHDVGYKLRCEQYPHNEVCVRLPHPRGFQRHVTRFKRTFRLAPGAGKASTPQKFLTPNRPLPRKISRFSRVEHKAPIRSCAVFSRTPRVCATESGRHKLSNAESTASVGHMVQNLWCLQKLFPSPISHVFTTFEGNITQNCKPWSEKNAFKFFWPATCFEP